MSTMPSSIFGNPMFGPQQGNAMGFGPPPSVTGPPMGPWGNPGNLPDPRSNQKDILRNAGFLGVQQGQLRNEMIPQFANTMFNMAYPAADVFRSRMDLGSPYYQQRQLEGFTQGTKDINDAMGRAMQQLAAHGYGATPSGATAGMIGGMNIAGGQSLAEQYLQNLFQNEQMQMAGAQGLSGLAGMFNPSGLFGATGPTGTTQGPSAAESFAQIMGSLFGKAGSPGAAVGAIG